MKQDDPALKIQAPYRRIAVVLRLQLPSDPADPRYPGMVTLLAPAEKSSGWWFQPTPLKNHGVRQLG